VGSSFIPITGYVLWYREHIPDQTIDSIPNKTMEINDTMSGLIEELQVYTQYDIRVAAVNNAGIGVYSPQMIVRTAEGRKYPSIHPSIYYHPSIHLLSVIQPFIYYQSSSHSFIISHPAIIVVTAKSYSFRFRFNSSIYMLFR
jgi:hypothetical protein